MLLKLALLIFLATLIDQTKGSSRQKRIINGNEVKNFEPYKFVAAILGKYGYNSYSLLCGGSIIHSRFILTSAHCFYVEETDQNVKEDMILTVAGSEYLNNNRSITRFFRYVQKLIIHENYTKYSHVNDLALLYLDKAFPMNLGLLSLIELNRGNEFQTGKCEAVGWGVDAKGERSKILLSLPIEMIPNYVCFMTFEMRPSDKIICGKNMNYGSVCSGDNGGPLICDGKLAGLIDSGDLNCSLQSTIFLDIAKYADWVDQSMRLILEQDATSASDSIYACKVLIVCLYFINFNYI